MGNSSSSMKLEIDELKKRLLDIEKLDNNNDGKVSKEEMDAWINTHKKDMDTLKIAIEKSLDVKYERIIQQNNEYKSKIDELECHIDLLKKQNEKLKSEINNANNQHNEVMLNKTIVNATDKIKLSESSKERINVFVEELLNDENVNIKYLPDFVERQIYRNVFNLLINLLEHILNTINIQFMGHEVKLDLKPQIDSTVDNNQENLINLSKE